MVSKDKRTLLAIIPARAGSKGVTGKNKSNVGGVPLIEYTVRSVQASRCVGLIVLTTDDVEILSRYRSRSGVFVVERPAALANDDSRVTDAGRTRLGQLPRGWFECWRGTPTCSANIALEKRAGY